MKKNWRIIPLVLNFLFFFSLSCEIEEIIIRWNPILCHHSCMPRLETSLISIKQISKLRLYPSSGTATMSWDKSFPFRYEAFRLAAGYAGIRFNDIRLTVRGFIIFENPDFYIVSDDDLSRFLIIGPPLIEPGRYTVANNIAYHPINTHLYDELLDAFNTKALVRISGPLFLPRTHLNTLVAERIEPIPSSQKIKKRNHA